jgi:hypothetical protein
MPMSDVRSATQAASRATVVDFARYRAAHRQAELPLFARPLRSLPATVTPFRRLSAREVAHRARMLAHLRAVEG